MWEQCTNSRYNICAQKFQSKTPSSTILNIVFNLTVTQRKEALQPTGIRYLDRAYNEVNGSQERGSDIKEIIQESDWLPAHPTPVFPETPPPNTRKIVQQLQLHSEADAYDQHSPMNVESRFKVSHTKFVTMSAPQRSSTINPWTNSCRRFKPLHASLRSM